MVSINGTFVVTVIVDTVVVNVVVIIGGAVDVLAVVLIVESSILISFGSIFGMMD